MEVEISFNVKFSQYTQEEEKLEVGSTQEPLDLLKRNRQPRSSLRTIQ